MSEKEMLMRLETKLNALMRGWGIPDPLEGYEFYSFKGTDGTSMWYDRENDLTIMRSPDGSLSDPESRTWEEGAIHAINPARDMSPFEPRGWKA